MEKKIINLFLYNNRLKFSEIEKNLKVRSNKLAYHLKQLIDRGILAKKEDYYLLSETAEYLIPYLSDKKPVLPVVLIHIGNKRKAFLYKREKRPFKGLLSLPGGRLLIGESVEDATKRIMKLKFNLSVKLKKINSVSLEHVKKSDKIIHSFLLIFVSAEAKDKIKLISINKNKKDMIPSDYKLIKNKLESKINIENLITRV